MARISLDGFRDPARRPRFIIWTAVAVLVIAAVMITVLGVTSTRWFCSEGCHKVQDDTITAYQHSSHSEISCMACHMPVNANPVVFILHKAEALGELYLTVTNNYSLPLNPESELALTIASTQCTQCHNPEKRPVTPTKGILIDHKVHEEKAVECGICHNRVAHNEDFKLTLTDPETGKPNRKHANFMTMTACFRCHTQTGESGGLEAPGECAACHPADFELKPPSHLVKGFFPEGHAKLAQAEVKRVQSFEASAPAESGSEQPATEGGEGSEATEELGPSLPPVESINECYTCHNESFCTDCHGLPMPHPDDFLKGHGELGKTIPAKCANCHGDPKLFCDECHHGSSMEREYDTSVPWLNQHPGVVAATGAQACFECHDPTFCANCHVNGSSQ